MRYQGLTHHDANGNGCAASAGCSNTWERTRNQIRYPQTDIEVSMLTDPTPDQQRAFDLIVPASPSPSPP